MVSINIKKLVNGPAIYKYIFTLFACLCQTLFAETFTVTTTAPSGTNSLYWAIEQTQQNIGADDVIFNIPKSDANYINSTWKIYLTNPLPLLTDDSTFLNGYSQNENQGLSLDHIVIEIHGEAVSTGNGFTINSAYNQIRGLAIGGFPESGITIKSTKAQHNKITGCYIGTDASGLSVLPNQAQGIQIIQKASYNIIGGTNVNDRNIISGNRNYGIQMENGHSNTIIGNYVGVDKTGLAALPNGETPRKYAGITISYQSKNNVIGNGQADGRNIISGNYRTGLRLEYSGTDSNKVFGNYIGVGVDGKTPIPNGEAGLLIGRGASYNIIGGLDTGEANIVSGNHSSGVQFARASYKNKFLGNMVGLDATGTILVPNDHNGIYFYGDEANGYPTFNEIGPDNIICGNGVNPPSQYWAGLSLDYTGTEHNIFFNNYIGITPDGQLTEGQPTGVLVQRGAHDNTFSENIIVDSQYNGVHIMDEGTVHNKFTRNQIYNNKLKPIFNERGGNIQLSPPVILNVREAYIKGTAAPNGTVEIYKDKNNQAGEWLTTLQCNSSGGFESHQAIITGEINALAIDNLGNTSELTTSIVLPVELTLFRYDLFKTNQIRLYWQTASETNNLGFLLQRKFPDQDFKDLAFIEGFGTSFTTHDYEYDDHVTDKRNIIYRLVQIDADGTKWFSSELIVNLANEDQLVIECFPNPFNSDVKVSIFNPKDQNISIEVYNSIGEKVAQIFDGFKTAGWDEFMWQGFDQQGNTISSGNYFIRFQTNENRLFRKILYLR